MADDGIARRTVAFFLLTSSVNFVVAVLAGAALALGLSSTDASAALTAGPALLAALIILALPRLAPLLARAEPAADAGRLRTASQAVAEGQQRASSAVPMDATLVAELQEQGAVLHELVGGAVQSLNVPAVESRPDLSGPQGVHTHE